MLEKRAEKRRRGRPPKDRAGLSETRLALVSSGVSALTEKGFSATGIDEVLRKVNVPKGSFYHYFKSKEAFGAELIDHYARYFSAKLDKIFLNESRTPMQRLNDFVDDAEAGMRRYNFSRGCLVGNLGQEMKALPPAYRDLLIAVFLEWQGKTAACFRAAAEAGEISSSIDCDKAAEFFWIGWEGAVLRAKLEESEVPLRCFAEGFIAGIER